MAANDGSEVQDILRGRLESLTPLPGTVFRVYLASSATDMCVERAVLAKTVYPELREYCRSTYNVDFQVMDLRSGFEFAEDPFSLPAILREIQKCQQFSLGPSFVLLAGDKYGSCTLPTAIPSHEFEQIRKCTQNSGQMALLNTWYSRDDNANPAEYVLRRSESGSSWGSAAAAEWRETAAELRRALQDGVRRCVQVGMLDVETENKYFISELENEVEKGLLEDPNANARCLLFHRRLEKVDLSHELAAHFVDLTTSGERDSHKMTQLESLVEQKVPSRIHSTNIHRFTVQWAEGGGIDELFHADYLEQLSSAVSNSLRRQMDAAMVRHRNRKLPMTGPSLQLTGDTGLYMEVLEHLHGCLSRCTRIVSRDTFLQRVRHYVIGDVNQPLVLVGPPGVGKSCVLAKAASLVSQWLEDEPSPTVVLVRFLGTTPASSTVDGLLRSLCRQIHALLDAPDARVPDGAEELQEYFHRLLQEVPAHMTVVMVLDGLEALRGEPTTGVGADGGSGGGSSSVVRWLPCRLPENIKLVVSSVNCDQGKKIVRDLQKQRISKRQFVEVTPLGGDACRTLLRGWLKNGRRRLSPPQWRAVDEKLREGCTPLYLRMLLEQLLSLRADGGEPPLPESSEALFSRVIDKLQETFGKNLVATVLGLLVLSKQGVTEMELEDMLSLDDKVLTDVFKDYVPPVRRMPCILWCKVLHDLRHYTIQCVAEGSAVLRFSHCLFERHVMKRFMSNWITDVGSRVRNLIIDYYTGRWAEEEKPFQLPEHQQRLLGLASPEATAIRYVPTQNTIVRQAAVQDGGSGGGGTTNKDSEVAVSSGWNVNCRKVRQLAAVLYNDTAYWDNEEALFRFMRLVLFNFEWLMAVLYMGEWQLLMRCLAVRQVIDNEDGEFEKRQLWVYTRCLQEVRRHLVENPPTVMIHLVAQLVNHYNFLTHPSALIRQADKRGGRRFCALVCPNQQLAVAGEVEYLDSPHHTTPIHSCLFVGSTLLTISDRLVGVAFDEYGRNPRTVVNVKVAGLSEADRVHIMVLLNKDGQETTSLGDQDPEDLLPTCQLLLALQHQARVFFVGAADGKVTRVIDCRRDVSAVQSNSKASTIARLQVVPSKAQDCLLHVTMSEGPLVLVYSCVTGELLQTLITKETILDTVLMEGGQYSVLMGNGDVVSLEELKTVQQMHGNSAALLPVPNAFATLKYGTILTAWNKGKWGSENGDVLAVGVQTGHLSAFFGVNPSQNASSPPLSATIHLPDHAPPHHIDTDVKGFRTKMAFVLTCTPNHIHLTKFEVGRNKQCSVSMAASLRKRLQEAHLYEEVIVGRHLNAVHVLSIGSQGDGGYSIQSLATLDVHHSDIQMMTPSNIMSGIGNNRLIGTVDKAGRCRAFNLATVTMSHEGLSRFDRMEGPIVSMTTGPSLVATREADNTYVSLWEVASGNLMKQFHHQERVLMTCLSHTERYLATVSGSFTLSVWDVLAKATQLNSSTPVLSHSLKGGQHWLFWSKKDASFVVVANSGQHVLANPKTHEVTEAENPLVPKPLVDAVLSAGGELLALGASGTVLTVSDPPTARESNRLDLRAKTGLSVSKYGSTVWRLAVWGANTLLLLGDTLLCCKQMSNSIFPLHKGMSSEALLLPAGPTLAFVNRGRLSVLTDINGAWKDYPYQVRDDLACITPDGAYVACLAAPNTLVLLRVVDGAVLASFRFLVTVTSLAFTGDDGAFLVVGADDGRMYPYVVADPDDGGHDERIYGLASRQQPVILQIERPHDPRYRLLRHMTAVLETSSYAGSGKDSDDDDDYDDEDDDDEDDDEDEEVDGDDSELVGDSDLMGDSEESDDEDSDESESLQASPRRTAHVNGPESNSKPAHIDKVNSSRKAEPSGRHRKLAPKKSVFMPLPNGAVCLAPVAYRQPALQVGHRSRIQKINNRFTEVAIVEEPEPKSPSKTAAGTTEGATRTAVPPTNTTTTTTTTSASDSPLRKAWTAPTGRDPRKASSRLTTINKRKGTSLSSPRSSSRGEGQLASRACVVS